MLQQVVDVKSPLGKQFYRDGATEKSPRVRIKQGLMEKQIIVYQPFILVLMSPAQERLLWKYDNHRCIQMDSICLARSSSRQMSARKRLYTAFKSFATESIEGTQ
jgi:hypothetical protein